MRSRRSDARRDFLESDVEQLELFLAEQRNRLRDAATSIVGIVERVPGGLAEVRPPLLSASDDEPVEPADEASTADDVVAVDAGQGTDVDERAVAAPPVDDLVIVTEIDGDDAPTSEPAVDDDPWGDVSDDATQAMPAAESQGNDRDEDDFRFSFDDDRN